MDHREVTIKEAENGYIVRCYKGDGELEELIAKDMPEAQKLMMKMMSAKKEKAKEKPKGNKNTPKVAKFY